MSTLASQRLLVVGASSGIGRACAVSAAAAGARVALAARRSDRLGEAAREAGAGAIPLACDVTDPASCERAVAEAAAAFDGLDGLVYAAGIARPTLLRDAAQSDWRAALDTNLIGASLITRAALPHLRASRGRAVYLSSISSEDPIPRPAMGLYVVSTGTWELW